MGRTDSKGRLLTPDMCTFEQNNIRIAPNDIPPGATLNSDARRFYQVKKP